MSDPDRRRAPRIALQQAVSLVIGNDGHEVAAITENLSSAGVLLYADQLIREGSEVGLILVVPEAEAEGKWMWCFGKVLTTQISNGAGFFDVRGLKIPVAVSAFPDEIYQAPKSWAEKAYPKLIYYNRLPKGGHFAAWEQPELFSEEIRASFRSLR